MGLFSLLEPTVAELRNEVETNFAAGHPALLLFENGLEGLHDQFLDRFVLSRPSSDHVLLFRGERMHDRDGFYDECVSVMPAIADYFGRNLDALDEVLRDPEHGLSTDPSKGTYWFWRRADVLYSSDREFFMRAFAALIEDARNGSRGAGLGGIGSVAQPAQRVAVLLTGRWSAMASEASNSQSFLHVTRWWQYRPEPPPEPTNLSIVKITKAAPA